MRTRSRASASCTSRRPWTTSTSSRAASRSGRRRRSCSTTPPRTGTTATASRRQFLAPELDWEVETIGRLVNAFFRWEFNSCEVIVKDGEAFPIDYANASPDMAMVSLHYHFPWAIQSLVAWCAFCAVTGRPMRVNQNTADYFAVADSELPYEEKLREYRDLADAYFQIEAFEEFRAEALPDLEQATVDYVDSAEFQDLIEHAVRLEVEPENQERLIERSRTAVAAWCADRRVAGRARGPQP